MLRRRRMWVGANLNTVAREGVAEKVASEQRLGKYDFICFFLASQDHSKKIIA